MVTDQRSEDKEDHEEATENSLTVDVAVADRRHSHQREVDAFPVRQVVNVLEVGERIARIFHLHTEDSWTFQQSTIKYNKETQ